MHFSDLSQVQQAISNGEITVTELVRAYLARIKEQSHLNAFLEVFETSALQKAAETDQKIAEGKAGSLAGMVIGIKDNICYRDHQVSAASKILSGFVSQFSATAVERLLQADAVIIGRLNCDEFAMGSSNENSAYGFVRNPIDETKVPGGSSGGSAAAVKAGLCLAALGSDTGGSIRQPASFTHTVGFKPTYGRVSRYGLIAYASSFDQIGPITNSVDDAARIMDVISGMDEFDSTALQEAPMQAMEHLYDEETFRFTCLKDCVYADGVDYEITSRIEEIIRVLTQKGHYTNQADFGHLNYLVPAYYVLTTAEASSNLSRYDGVHFGYRDPEAHDVESTYKGSRTKGFGNEVKRRIMLGTFVLSSGYYDAYFDKGHRVRRIIRNRMDELFSASDFLILPTSPVTPFGIGENTKDPIKMYLQDIFTVKANLSGNPAISLPLGRHSNGLPFGVQLIGRMGDDARLLSCAKKLADLFKVTFE